MTTLLALVGLIALAPEIFRLIGVAFAAGVETIADLRAYWRYFLDAWRVRPPGRRRDPLPIDED